MARGKIEFTITGGEAPYYAVLYNNFNPINGFGGYYTNNTGTKEIVITEDYTPGNYTLNIIDNNGCIINSNDIVLGVFDTYNLRFFVYDEQDDQVPEATINITGIGSQQTSLSGQVTFFDLPSGTYNYSVNKSGYAVQTGSVNIVDSLVNVDIILIQTYQLTFNVVDEFGDPIIDATVEVPGVGTQETNSSGQVVFSVVPGTYSYTVSATDYNDGTGSITVGTANYNEGVVLTSQL